MLRYNRHITHLSMRYTAEHYLHKIITCSIFFSLGSVGQMAFAQNAVPIVASAPQPPNNMPVEEVTKTTTQNNNVPPDSLFFTAEESARIRAALSAYEQHASLPPAVEKSAASANAPDTIQYVYPQFFLESLVYHSPRNWVIWVNGQKISSEMPEHDMPLHVLAITNGQVKFIWTPASMAKINDSWDHMRGATPPEDEVVVNKAANQVIFTLKPNQTFSSYAMRVLEGKVQQVSTQEGGNPTTSVDKMPAVLPSNPAASSAVPVKGGLDGLLNSYHQIGHTS